MFALLATLAVVGGGLVALRWVLDALAIQHHVEHTLRGRRMTVRERYATVAEQELRLKERLAESKGESLEMPDDLKARIDLWDDQFAKEQEDAQIRALYAETKDWDRVRQALPVLVPESSR